MRPKGGGVELWHPHTKVERKTVPSTAILPSNSYLPTLSLHTCCSYYPKLLPSYLPSNSHPAFKTNSDKPLQVITPTCLSGLLQGRVCNISSLYSQDLIFLPSANKCLLNRIEFNGTTGSDSYPTTQDNVGLGWDVPALLRTCNYA